MEGNKKYKFVTVVLPMAVPKPYIYAVPPEMQQVVEFGIRVEVPLRNKLYSGIIVQLHENVELDYKAKFLTSILDTEPIIHKYQYAFWQWIADYYCCTVGEVMNVALPGGLRLSSETLIHIHPEYEEGTLELTDDEYMIAEALTIRNMLTIEEVKDILNRKTVYPLIRSLLDKKVLTVKEELVSKYKPKTVGFMRLKSPFDKDQKKLTEAIESVQRSKHQTNALLAYVTLSKTSDDVPRSSIYEMSGAPISALKSLEKKGIIELFDKEVSRLDFEESEGDLPSLSDEQVKALASIKDHFEEEKVTLLHGVTGSGKTRVYMELIKEVMQQGKQTLYLLPEIALTTQIVSRLQHIFGEDVAVFHSRLNNHERVELYKEAMHDKKIILGARSALFLPFNNLGLIIVDEEHDPSFKQNDPNPRYNARDAAVILGKITKSQVLLGTATPSLESYYNVKADRYGLVEMKERHGQIAMPEMEVVDIGYARKTGRINGFFTHRMLDILQDALNLKQQVLLFQNRRGYSPSLQCNICGWKGECANCDVTLTYHKYFDELRCHYCGFKNKNPHECPSCGNDVLEEVGFGTEKIEDEIAQIFPDAKVARLDYDTAKTKNSFIRILEEFAAREIDILVGTQMITKGLDFENVGVVGVINADTTLRFPDFRAGERAFQLLTQVAGRAGRRKKQGKVVIQTYAPSHPVITETLNYDYPHLFERETRERQKFVYPPFYRMIAVELKHKKPMVVEDAARYIAKNLRDVLGQRIVGPAAPGIARVKGYYRQNIMIKMEKNPRTIDYVKKQLLYQRTLLKTSDGYKSVRMKIDVDPY